MIRTQIMASHLELLLQQQLELAKIPKFEREYRFAVAHVGEGRALRNRLKMAGLKDWRFDFAWPDIRFAVEIEGVTPSGGRHQRIYGFLEDLEKYHEAQALGWTVYRTSGPLIVSGKALQLIDNVVNYHGRK